MASSILEHAGRAPKRAALVTPGEPALGFGELAERVARLRDGLARQGIRAGDRVLVLAPLGADVVAISLALLASGATLVTLDGQLGARRVARALAAARPRAVISLGRLLRYWPLSPSLARARRFAIDDVGAGAGLATLAGPGTLAGLGALAGLAGLGTLARLTTQPFAVLVGEPRTSAVVAPTAAAMVSFSSGTSGRPKGAERTHDILYAQHEALARAFPVADGDVDMPAFPALTLHNLACGITTVLPPVDLRQPASVDGAAIVEAARRYGVTTMSGSPAYLARVARYLIDARVQLPRVRRVAVGGAPVSRALCRTLRQAFPECEGLVVYGSTEAEPMAHVGIDEVASAEGDGFLVGSVDPAAEIELVELPAEVPAGAGDRLRDFRVGDGAVGEIVVRGRHVVARYVGDDEAERRTKLPSRAGVWHRTGDLARRDARGRLWLAGRVADVVAHGGRALHPFDLEADVLDCAGVAAAALVANEWHAGGVVAVELERSAPATALARVRALLDARGLSMLPLRPVARMPMDARHQSKVDRVALRQVVR